MTNPSRREVLKIGDELNQCLQIIVTNAGNIADSDTSVENHSAARIIESAVGRAAKAVRRLAAEFEELEREARLDEAIAIRIELSWAKSTKLTSGASSRAANVLNWLDRRIAELEAKQAGARKGEGR